MHGFRSDLSSAHHSHIRSTPYVSPNTDPDPTPDSTNNLTPTRKHYKLSKDGSGSEVWPESVEKIFVEGLRAYCSSEVSFDHSAKASESPKKCRSRLRNTFLVQYLARHGIDRSRKQVASHLQVLKNMWKDDGNYSNYYNLVAGLDTISQSPASDHRSSRHPSPAFSCTSSASSTTNSSAMGSPVWNMAPISSSSSSPSSSVHSSPLGIQQSIDMGCATQPIQSIHRLNHRQAVLNSSAVTKALSMTELNDKQASFLNHQEPPTHRQQQYQPQLDKSASNLQAPVGSPTAVSHQVQSWRQQLHILASDFSSYHDASSSASGSWTTSTSTDIPVSIPSWTPPTLTNLYLLTEGMSPLEVSLIDTDNVGTAYLGLQLDVPHPQSFSGNSQGFGVQLQAYLPTRWIGTRRTVCRCFTQVWGVRSGLDDRHSFTTRAPRRPIPHSGSLSRLPLSLLRREEGAVDIVEVPGDQGQSMDSKQQMLLTLPNSALSTCRWLEKGAMMINQELCFDTQVILRLTYMLNRPVELPAARLLEWERLSTSSPSARLNQSTPQSYTEARQRIHARTALPEHHPEHHHHHHHHAPVEHPSYRRSSSQSRSSLTLYDHVPL